jgi:hypothetical protein
VRAQRLQHAEAVAFGQHHVEHDHVVVEFDREMRAFLAVKGYVDYPPLLRQAGAQIVNHLVFVFHDEQFHARLLMYVLPL